jgi:hypothetical protein
LAYHRLTDVGRQRQPLGLVSLPADDERAGPPIEVVEPKRGELPRAQAEADERGQDGEVSAPSPCAAITGPDEGLDLGSVQSLRKSSQSPPRNGWHRGRQRPRNHPVDMEEAEQRPQGGHRQRRGATRLSRGAGDHEGAHVGGTEGIPIQGEAVGGDPGPQKWANRVDIAANGRAPQPPLSCEVLLVPRDRHVHRSGDHRRRRRGQHAPIEQVGEERPQGLAGQVVRVAGAATRPQEPLHIGCVQFPRLDALAAEPVAEVRHEMHL